MHLLDNVPTQNKASSSPQFQFPNQKLRLLRTGEALLFCQETMQALNQHYKIIGKLTGITSKDKNDFTFYNPPYLLSKYSVAYLIDEKIIDWQHQIEKYEKQSEKCQLKQVYSQITQSLEYKVFKELKKHFYLISAHKFGGTFLAYSRDPMNSHADYIVFTIQLDLNMMTRLAEICKKQCLHARETAGKIHMVLLQRAKNQKKRNRSK